MSLSSPVIERIDFATRKIYIAGAVETFNPITDVYEEYAEALRLNTGNAQFFFPLCETSGGENKTPDGSRKREPTLTLLDGAKLVFQDGSDVITWTGELLSDDGSKPYIKDISTAKEVIPYVSTIEVRTGYLSDAQIDRLSSDLASKLGGTSTGGGCGCASPDAVDIKTVKPCVIDHANPSSIQAVSHGHIGIKQRTAQLIGTQRPNIIEVYP